MSLSSISSTTSLATSQFLPLSTKSNTDDAAVTNAPGTSRFASAISDAFASISISLDGTSTTSTTTSDASTTDGANGSDALGSFLQSLFAALHGQSAGSAPPADASSSDQDPSKQTVSAPGTVASTSRGEHVGHAHHGHGGKLEANLQSLISELQSSTATTATADPGTVASTSSTTTDSTLATLENKFDALLSASGSTSTNGNDSLATFLQTLAAGLHGAPPTGNVVSTQA